MSRDPIEPTADERRAGDAVRALEAARPEPAFRARLRQDFVTGRIGERAVVRLSPPWWRRGWAAALAPAAAVVVVLLVAGVNRGPQWTVMAANGDGIAVVDGVPMPMPHAAEEARRLRAGARVQVPPGASLDLAGSGTMMMEIAGGAEVTLPATPGRWFARGVEAHVRSGTVRFSTGARFHGARLHVETPEAGVEVTGTTLAVICEPRGTCVCVYEGVVRVRAHGGSIESVSAGRRRFVYNDGRAPIEDAMLPGERTRLGEIREHRDDWQGGGR
jgi:ferric-dicitrate binding protein FerR (iron transport regulator)